MQYVLRYMFRSKMKSVLAATLMMVASSLVYADECKYRKDEVDDFTGEKLLTTKWRLFSSAGASLSASGISIGDSDFLDVKVESGGALGYEVYGVELRDWFIVQDGASLLILLADDSIIELTADKEVVGRTRTSPPNTNFDGDGPHKIRYGISTKAVIRYSLDADAFAALSGQPASYIRLSEKKRDLDYKVHGKLTDEIQNSLLCLRQDTL